jgi:hypothetical protein
MYWLAFYEFPEKFIPEFSCPEKDSSDMKKWIKVAKSLAGLVAFKDICFVSERPIRLTLDERNRLHNENEAALEYSDGYALYAWHGVSVPEWMITTPEKITAQSIDSESNQEIKRVMIERFGLEKYALSGVKVHQDDFGTLYQKRIIGTDEVLTLVHVVNGSKERDGTYKEYFLEVHPELRPLLGPEGLGEPQELTARNAVASTYGMRGEEYCVTVRT